LIKQNASFRRTNDAFHEHINGPHLSAASNAAAAQAIATYYVQRP
jgi:hypothetical protein